MNTIFLKSKILKRLDILFLALYLWLPLYLNEALGYSSFTSGMLSTLFDIGGVLGGPIIGFMSDRDGKTLNWIYKACLYSSVTFIILAFVSHYGIMVIGAKLLST